MTGENKSRMEIETFHWPVLAISLGASCIGGLMNVSINYLEEVDSDMAAGTYENMRTGPHHVFRIIGETSVS